jgi:hypothetical protein
MTGGSSGGPWLLDAAAFDPADPIDNSDVRFQLLMHIPCALWHGFGRELTTTASSRIALGRSAASNWAVSSGSEDAG